MPPHEATQGTTSPLVVELPIQRATRERLIEGMCGIIRRMTWVAPRGDLVLADHDERELAIELFSYLEGVKRL